MATEIEFPDGFSMIIDATPEYNYSLKAQLTKHKIEEGSEISDHRVKENINFSLSGIISEFTETEGGGAACIEYRERLEKAYYEDELLIIYTSDKIFKNMAIAGLTVPKKASQGKALFFSLDLEEARFAETKSVKVDKVPKAALKKNNPSLTEEKKKQKTEELKLRATSKLHQNKLPTNPITLPNVKLK